MSKTSRKCGVYYCGNYTSGTKSNCKKYNDRKECGKSIKQRDRNSKRNKITGQGNWLL
jgi:hypothetical protein